MMMSTLTTTSRCSNFKPKIKAWQDFALMVGYITEHNCVDNLHRLIFFKYLFIQIDYFYILCSFGEYNFPYSWLVSTLLLSSIFNYYQAYFKALLSHIVVFHWLGVSPLQDLIAYTVKPEFQSHKTGFSLCIFPQSRSGDNDVSRPRELNSARTTSHWQRRPSIGQCAGRVAPVHFSVLDCGPSLFSTRPLSEIWNVIL